MEPIGPRDDEIDCGLVPRNWRSPDANGHVAGKPHPAAVSRRGPDDEWHWYLERRWLTGEEFERTWNRIYGFPPIDPVWLAANRTPWGDSTLTRG